MMSVLNKMRKQENKYAQIYLLPQMYHLSESEEVA